MILRKFFTGFIFFTLLLSSTLAAQTCVSTPIPVNGQDVNDLGGSSDTNIIAVTDNGQIIIFDGTNWVLQTDPDIPEEDFNDVFVFDANNAVVVGDDGAVVIQVNGDWQDISISNQDYTTIWAYATNDIFVAGDRGRIYHYTGTPLSPNWTSIGTNNNNDDFVDSWGDATYIYFLNDDGDIFRYNRSNLSTWDELTPACAGNVDYNGFTSDGAGNFYLFGELNVAGGRGVIYKWDGVNAWTTSTCTQVFQTTSSDDINAVSINPDGTFTAVGDDGVVVTSADGTTWTEISSGGEDINAIYTLSNGNSIFGADNGSNQICTEDQPHFSIIHDGFSTTCAAEAIKIQFHDASHVLDTTYTGTINISTSSGNGTWALVTGANSGSFTDNGNGSASYTFVAGDSGEIILSLANTTAEILNLNISDGTYTEFATEDNNLTFSGSSATITFADDFSTNTYSNSTGSNAWSTNWTESGETDGALLGDLTVTTGSFKFEGNDDDAGNAIIKSLTRDVDLTGATGATIQFKYQRQSLERNNDEIRLEANDGSGNWARLARFRGNNDASFVLSPVINVPLPTTQIRFINSSGLDAGDFVYFDDIVLTATGLPSPCNTLDHLRIIHDGEGLTCDGEQVTVRACADSNCTAEYTAGSVVATLTPDGDAVTFTGNTLANVRQSTVGLSTLGATITSIPAPLNGVRCFNGATETCSMNFVKSGFRFTDGANPPNPITIGIQIAGKASNVNPGAQTIALQAVRTDTDTGACVGVFSDSTDVNVEMSSQCNNPTTCIAASKVSVTNNATTTSINNNPNTGVSSYSSVPLLFTTNSQAILNFAYPDVGQISLHARYNILDSTGTPTGNYMSGSSNLLVVKPATFILTNILRADDTANPANTAATDTPYFVKAGADFKATIEARDINGNITPNYGNENDPEGVLLTSTLVTGLGLTNNPAITNNTIAGTEFGSTGAINDTDGVASVINLNWPEVGIITITPSVSGTDGNVYLGAGGITGTTSGNVGRFVPDHFDTLVTHACNTFTYSGQPFVVTVFARNNANATTVNYRDTFAHGITLSDANPAATPTGTFANNTLNSASFSINPNFGRSTSTNLTYTFSTKETVPDTIEVRATDITDISISSSGFAEGTTEIHSGRMRIENAFGSELVDMPITAQTEYFDLTTNDYAINSSDTCTKIDIKLTDLDATNQLILGDGNPSGTGETCVVDDSNFSVNNPADDFSCLAGDATHQFNDAPTNGSYNLYLKAPGTTKTGDIGITLYSTPTWLQLDDDNDGNPDGDPTSTASFGLYRGDDRIIYWREVF